MYSMETRQRLTLSGQVLIRTDQTGTRGPKGLPCQSAAAYRTLPCACRPPRKAGVPPGPLAYPHALVGCPRSQDGDPQRPETALDPATS